MKIEPVYKISYTETYNKYKDIAAVSLKVFTSRMTKEKKNFTLESALLTPKLYEGKDEWSALAASNGINRNTYRSRVNTGWDKKLAATTPTKRTGRPSKKSQEERFNYIKFMIQEYGEERAYSLLNNKNKKYYNDNKDLFEGMI